MKKYIAEDIKEKRSVFPLYLPQFFTDCHQIYKDARQDIKVYLCTIFSGKKSGVKFTRLNSKILLLVKQ